MVLKYVFKKIVKKLDWNKLVISKTEYWKILWQRPKAKG